MGVHIDQGSKGHGKKKGNDDHLSVKHLLPKTKVSHTILHDNMSQQRLLDTRKQMLDRRAHREKLLVERTKKTFVLTQVRKQGKWKREDDVRINCLNLPMIKSADAAHELRPPSMRVIYNSPSYVASQEDEQIFVPLRPVMGIRREKTEILSHRTHIAVCRLPNLRRVSSALLERYDKYRGAKYLTRGVLSSDKRFTRCETLLGSLGVRTPEKLPAISFDDIDSRDRKGTRGFLYKSPTKQMTLPVQMTGGSPFMGRCTRGVTEM